MSGASFAAESPGIIMERVRLPDNPQPGRYDAAGREDPHGCVFVERVGPTAHAWAVFQQDLEPDQRAAMVFENVTGNGILDVIVSQWIKGGAGKIDENLNRPYVGDFVIRHLARQRANGAVKVVGQNSGAATISAAAGLLYIPGSGG